MSKQLICVTSFLVLVILAGNATAKIDPATVTTGHVYLFDDVTGTTVPDDSANDNAGIIVGDPQVVDGLGSKALQFNGVDDGVTIPDSQYINITGGPWPNRTVVAVFKCDDVDKTSKQTVFEEGGTTRGLTIYVHEGLVYGAGWNRAEYNWNGAWLSAPIGSNEWHAVAIVIREAGDAVEDDKFEMWMDGRLIASAPGGQLYNHSNDNAIGYTLQNNVFHDGNASPATGHYFGGAIDEVWILNDALTQVDLSAWGKPWPYAYAPSPADGTTHEDTWATLSWKPGAFAASHDVYLGENFNDVNEATRDSELFRGNQTGDFYVAGFPGYAYPDGLTPGTTYYWRIDEVNDADPNSPWKGTVWSFSIPPQTAYNPDPADGAELVDVQPTLTWTQGFKAKLHYVVFGEDYDTVANAAMGMPSGTASYSPGLLKMAKTYYWRIDEFDGFATHKGEVWSFTTLGAVNTPNPADGAVDVKTSQILTWVAGGVAASHEVYFGTDEQAVANAGKTSPEYKSSKALGDESYDPGILTMNTTYYWRIDEVNSVNPDSPWTGNVWSFTTGNFAVVDDFEGYTDDDPNGEAIWQTWIDGFGVADNGSQVGYLLPPYAEQTIVHGGSQSMPLLYNNVSGVTNSEATLTLTWPRDWTQEGVADLSLWFHGLPGSVGSFTEVPAGTYTITAEGADIWNAADQFHYAFKTLSGAGTIEAQVLSVQNTNAWAKAGVMIRETLDAGSKFAAVYITPGNGCRFQARLTTDAAATSDTSVATPEQIAITAPYWVRLERTVSGTFRGYYSSDGTNWQSMSWNPQSITMASNVYIGLALTSHSAGVVCEAKFSNVSTTGTVGAQWAHQDIGIASNAAEPLYVAVSNASGSPAVVANSDPAAATIDAWTEWVVPLQSFADQGINLRNVDKIAIGLGSKSSVASSGGSGTVYIDDIRLYRP